VAAFGAIDLFSGSSSIAGTNLWQTDKNPLVELDAGIEDVIGKQGKNVGGQIIQMIEEFINGILGFPLLGGQQGTMQDITQFFGNILQFLGDLNPLSPNFNIAKAAEDFIKIILTPTNLLAVLVPNASNSGGVTGFIPLENLALDLIAGVVGGAQGLIDAILGVVGVPAGSGTEQMINQFFTEFLSMFANPISGLGFMSGSFNPLTAVSTFITTIINPLNLLAPLVGGFVPGGLIPGLDASKITSGVFANSFVPGLNQTWNSIVSAMGGPLVGNLLGDVTHFLQNIPGLNIVTTLLASVIPGLDATKIISGSFPQAMITNLVSDLTAVENMAQGIIDSILKTVGFLPGIGNLTNLFQYFTDFLGMFGNPLLASGSFNPVAAVETFITAMINPLNLLAPIVSDPTKSGGVVGFVPLENLALELIGAAVGSAQSVIDAILSIVGFAPGAGTPFDVTHFFTDFLSMFGMPGLTSVGFNPLTAVSTFITTIINPLNLLAPLVGGFVPGGVIPGLDASKITSGVFANSFIPGLNQTWNSIVSAMGGPLTGNLLGDVTHFLLNIPGVNIISTLLASVIPGLDATKIISGILSIGQIPTSLLGAGNISDIQAIIDNIFHASFGGASTGNAVSSIFTSLTSIPGVNIISSLLASVIPGLDASKIISGTFAQSMITNLVSDLGSIVNNIVSAMGGPTTGNAISAIFTWLQKIPGVNIISTLLASVIPGLDATKIISGIFGLGQIPFLPASQITSGTFLAGLIPGLDATKIISGVFTASLIPNITKAMSTDMQSIIDMIFQAMFGGSTTGNTVASVKTSLLNIPGVNIISALLASVIPGLDATKIISGVLGIGQIPTGSLGAGNISDIQHIIDYIFQAVHTGSSATGNPVTSVLTSLQNIPGVNIISTLLASVIPGLDASKIISGTFGLGFLPSVQTLIDYAFQAMNGGTSTGNPITSFKTSLLNIPGVNIISTLLASVIPGLDATKIISGIFGTGLIPSLDASKITSGTFLASLIPGLDASKIISGTFALGFLPSVQTLIDYAFQAMNGGTSTGNPITSFKTSLLNIPGVNIISALLASVIPGLDATKIISGIFGVGLIPSLPAGQITSGTFLASLIPGLDATKIISGIFSTSLIPNITKAMSTDMQAIIDMVFQAMSGGSSTGNTVASVKTSLLNIPGVNIISALLASVIPGLDASKIISGLFSLGQIPFLPASQITSGVFGLGLIPGLPASQITSGVFGTSLIPGLDASQLISGTLGQWILPLLPVGSIGQTSPNLLANPTYAGSSSVLPGAGWSWDGTTTHTADGSGSVKVVLDGTAHTLLSDPPTPVSQGQTLNLSHWIQWSGVTGSGGVFSLALVAYLAGAIVNNVTLQTITNPAATGAWQQLSGSYTVPSGVDSIRLQLNVAAAGTAGTANWDDASATKTQLLAESWTAGLPGDLSNLNTAVIARALQTDVMSLVNTLGLGSFSSVGGGLTSITNRLTGLGTGGLFDASMLGNIANIPQLLVGSVAGIGGIANIGAALQQTWDATSGLGSGLGTLTGIIGRLTNLTTGGLFNAAQLSNIANIPLLSAGSIPGLDATKIISGILAIGQIPTGSLGASNIGDLQSVIDGTTNNLGGYSVPLTGTTQSLANTAMDTIFTTVISNAQQLSSLTQTTGGASNSGMSANVNFANYANGNLPAAFTVNYTGPGTSTIGILNGLAHWNVVANGNRSARAIYNIGPTLSDYQLVGATPNSGPGYNYNSSQSGANYQIARSDLAGNNYVYSKFTSTGPLSYNVELGTIVAGVKTVFAGPTAVTSNAALWLVAGTPTSPRQFQVLSGSSPILTYTDAGNVSQMGANYRYWGFGGDVLTSGSNTAAPGDGAAVSVADHQPPSTIGSFFRQYRISTTTVNVNSGFALCPANFFDTVDRVTADFVFTPSTNSLTVGYEGTYYCNLRYQIANLPGNTKFDPTLYQNGTMVRRGNGAFADGSLSANSPSGIETGFMVYCKAGDVLQPGFWASTSMSGLLQGSGDQTGSYFEVGLLNRSLA
jgi:hypothetical protein